MVALASYGLRPSTEQAFARAVAELRTGSYELGRVVRVERGFAGVVRESLDEALVHVPKSLARAGIEAAPVTGDWVVMDAHKQALIKVLPRLSLCVRRAAGKREQAQAVAANVDVIFVLTGLDGDFNVRRIERYLTVVHESGAQPVVLLTKAGLVPDASARREEVAAVAPGVDVHAIDVKSGIATDAPGRYLGVGVTAALLGSSGVGKSTLANFLLGREAASTREVRAHDSRGKHTTSRRELYLLSEGGVIIDTPGMRELAPWAETDALEGSFSDLIELASRCQFGDCRHASEPGCAVRKAADGGEVDPERLRAFLALHAELTAQRAVPRRFRSGRPPR